MRYVPFKQQVRDAETDEFLGIATIAFAMRKEDEGGLSTTWIEHYGEKSLATYGVAAGAFRDSLPSKKLAAKAYLAVGNVGECKKAGLAYEKKLRFVIAPDGANTGHVEIHRFSDDDRRLLDALVDVFYEHVPVKGLIQLVGVSAN